MELPFIVSIILCLILAYWGAWISSSETALFSISSHTLKTYHVNSDPKKRLIAELLSHPRDLLVTIFMINTFTNIMFQNVASNMFGEQAGWGLKVGIPLIITLVLGEIIPKYIGLQNNLAIAYHVVPTINFLQNSLRWARKWIIAITAPVSRVMFFFLKKEPAISKEEIEHVLRTSQKHGVLQQEETELLAGCLNLQESQVKELMQPKEDILYYELSQPLTKLIHLFDEETLTRVPVCNQSLENVLGVITAMEFFHHQTEIASSKDLIPYLFKPFYVPETTPARLLLKRMDEQEQVLAIIVNEYGSLSGLISREDLIEVVVGQIEETKDPQPQFIAAGKSEVIANGKWEFSEFKDYFNVDLKSPFKSVTISGWLIEQIGEIPKSGSKYELEGFLFHVLAASPTRITRLFIRKLTKPPT